MPGIADVLFAICYTVLAAAAAALGHYLVPLTHAQTWLAGLTAFVVLGQTHLFLSRGGARARVKERLEESDERVQYLEDELEVLTSGVATLKANVKVMRQELTGMASAVESRMDAREKQILSEMKVLEGLVRAFDTQEAGGLTGETILDLTELAEPEGADAHFVDVVREALEQNRIDIHLQPIVSLPQRKLRFYEALSRLRDAQGTIIMPREYLRVAEPAGLMGVIDNLLLFRCVQAMRQLAKRAPGVAIFCNISGYSLRDSMFFPQFVDYMEANADLAGQLVFEFGQSDLQTCSGHEEACLERLASHGFGFSMDKVESLNIDFRALGRFNFRFVKIGAQLLLGDAAAAKAPVEAADLKALAGRYGIDLIAEKIEDERTVVNVLDYNFDFGQGFLFGLPAPIEEVLAKSKVRAESDGPAASLGQGSRPSRS